MYSLIWKYVNDNNISKLQNTVYNIMLVCKNKIHLNIDRS